MLSLISVEGVVIVSNLCSYCSRCERPFRGVLRLYKPETVDEVSFVKAFLQLDNNQTYFTSLILSLWIALTNYILNFTRPLKILNIQYFSHHDHVFFSVFFTAGWTGVTRRICNIYQSPYLFFSVLCCCLILFLKHMGIPQHVRLPRFILKIAEKTNII